MKLSQRIDYIEQFKRKWEDHPGVKLVKIGYERYGMQVDLEVMREKMTRENNWFPIEELKTKQRGQHGKVDRIRRLEPDIRERRFLFPCVAYNADFGAPGDRVCYWSIWTEKEKQALIERITEAEEAGDDDLAESLKPALAYNIGQITFRPVRGLTRRQRNCERTGQYFRVVEALQRRDEQGNIYDLTRVFFDELLRHPFARHDDLIDAASRIYDIDPQAPEVHEAQSTEPLDVD